MATLSAWCKRLLLVLVPLLLTGCVNYEVGINFTGLHHGKIVQQIQLGQQLTSFSQADVEEWLGSLEQRAQRLGGSSKRVSPQKVTLIIPFANAEQLESKFNRFFQPKASSVENPPSELVQLNSHLSTQQTNWLLFQWTQLNLNIDLTALGTIQGKNSRIVGANSLLDLQFHLQAPGGIKIINVEPTQQALLVENREQETIWQLQPGENNQIELGFWLPEPLGWGAIAIVILVYLGWWLKYGRPLFSLSPK